MSLHLSINHNLVKKMWKKNAQNIAFNRLAIIGLSNIFFVNFWYADMKVGVLRRKKDNNLKIHWDRLVWIPKGKLNENPVDDPTRNKRKFMPYNPQCPGNVMLSFGLYVYNYRVWMFNQPCGTLHM